MACRCQRGLIGTCAIAFLISVWIALQAVSLVLSSEHALDDLHALDELQCPGRVAIVTAIGGSGGGVLNAGRGVRPQRLWPAPSLNSSCTDFFAFVTDCAFTGSGWTIFGPEPCGAWSKSWNDAMHNATLRENATISESLDFALESIKYSDEHKGPFHKDLEGIMLPKYVKLQLLRIDVLASYEKIIWVDASLQLNRGFPDRISQMLGANELLLLRHPSRDPPTVHAEMEGALREQARYVSFRDYHARQMKLYDASGFNDDVGLFWCCLFVARRTQRNVALYDLWWDEVRRWGPPDQPSFPYALWKTQQMYGMIPVTYVKTGRWELCSLALGHQYEEICCRRCGEARFFWYFVDFLSDHTRLDFQKLKQEYYYDIQYLKRSYYILKLLLFWM